MVCVVTRAERAEIAYVARYLDELAASTLARRELDREITMVSARLEQLLELGPILPIYN